MKMVTKLNLVWVPVWVGTAVKGTVISDSWRLFRCGEGERVNVEG